MVDTRQFNNLPLLTAKPGLDSALDTVHTALDAFFTEGPSGIAHLEQALAELHRIGGVLTILSLDGAARFSREFETVLSEMKGQQTPASAMQKEVVEGALESLEHFLDALAGGAPNTAMRLFYAYQELHQLRGLESAFEVDLFFPELNVPLPATVLDTPMDPATAPAQIKTARAQYQQALLKWLKQDNPQDALRSMRGAVQVVMNCVPQDQSRAFWWVAAGLLECLILDGLPADLNPKKLLGRIDLQMKSLAESSAADEYATLCEMLYLVARSLSVSESVESIKQTYDLASYLPQEPPLPPGELAEKLDQMRHTLMNAQEALERCSPGDAANNQQFTELMEQLYIQSEGLDRNTLQFLCKQMYTAVSHPDDPDAIHHIKLDMAMAMLLLGNGIEHYLSLGNNFHEQARLVTQRLLPEATLSQLGESGVEALVTLHCQAEEQEVLMPLAREMKNNMQQFEQTLNAFFGNPAAREDLASLPRLLSQVHGGLYMLNLERPARLMASLQHLIGHYVAGNKPSSNEMRDVAAAVSALDAYVHDLTQGQKSDSSAMEEMVAALQADQAGMPEEEVVAEPAAPAGVSVREGGEDDELLEVFLEEAQEVLETLHANLLACQNNHNDREALVTIRRSFHTLKGSGRMVGLTNLGEVAWALERAMNKWLQAEKPATPAVLEMIGDAGVLFQHWIDKLRSGGTALIDTVALLASAQRVENGEEETASVAPKPAAEPAAESQIEPVLEVPVPELVAEPLAEPAEQEVAAAPAMEELSLPSLELQPEEHVQEAEPLELALSEFELAPAEPMAAVEPTAPAAPEPELDLEDELENETQNVQIGELSISPALFKIATDEASSTIETMKRFAGELHQIESPAVSYDFMRAAHTLAGVNRTMGLKQIGELALTLEQCLQTHLDVPAALVPAQLALIDEAVATLDDMNQTLLCRQNPEAQTELINRLQQACKSQLAAQLESKAKAASEGLELTLDQMDTEQVTPSTEAPVTLQDIEIHLPVELEPMPPSAEPAGFDLGDLKLDFAATEPATLEVGPAELLLPEQELEAEAEQPEAESMQPLSLELPVAEPEGAELDLTAAPSAETEAGSISQPAENAATSADEDVNLVSYAEYQAQLAAEEAIKKAQDEQAQAEQVAEQLEAVAEPAAEQQPEAQPAQSELAADIQQLQAQIAEVQAEEARLRAQQTPKQRTVHDDLDEQLLPIFLEEAEELYPQISKEMRSWRELPEDSGEGLKFARQLQRSLHTLKGSARMAGAMRLGELTHRVEDYLEKVIASGKRDAALMDELDNYFDRIENALDQLKQGGTMVEEPAAAEPVAPAAAAVEPSVVVAEATARPVQQQPAEAAAETPDERAAAAMLRVRSDIVDDLVNEAGEISVARSRIEIELRAFKDGLQELTTSVNHLRKLVREIEIHAESQMQARVSVASDSAEKFDPLEFDRFTRFQELTRFMNESVHDVQTVQQTLIKNMDETAAAMSAQAHLNRDLQQRLMSIRMLPFSSISQRLYRIVRQTGKELNKKVNLELRGGEVELDRSVLEKMTAPFEHLLRNSIVHGMEDAAQRESKGKPAIGNISLSLRQEGNEVVFEYVDDGAGLNLPKLRQKGMETGLIREGDQVSDEQVMRFIFATGLSTATELTEISGRGVGMDVVRSEIEGLGGRIEVHSEMGKGVRFAIYLPLTLAVMKTLAVRAVQQVYEIPAAMVEQVQQVKPGMLEILYRDSKVDWQGRSYPLHYLPSLLGDYEHMPEIKPYNAVLLLRSGEQRLALHVDELLGNEEVVVKNIGPQLARLPGIAGATIQGDGKVVLILNPAQLVQQVESAHELQPAPAVEEIRKVPVVMVVDDSLTVRKITSRLLNRAGYEVLTAKDGVDALEQLVDVTPDAMLLDVEMPRMDGFELTKQLRRNAKTLHTPIIMITSRTADKHKNYALELGVDEYLGKPYQEEELLGHIARLINAHAVV